MPASAAEIKLFGQGIRYPLEVTPSGTLATSAGSDLLWDSVEFILDSEETTCSLDPTVGSRTGAYDTVESVNAFLARIGDAISRSEPRVSAIHVEALSIDPSTQALSIRITLTPIVTQVPENRVFEVWSL